MKRSGEKGSKRRKSWKGEKEAREDKFVPQVIPKSRRACMTDVALSHTFNP